MKFWEGIKNLASNDNDKEEYDEYEYSLYDDEYEDDDDDDGGCCERISVWDAADIWLSSGMDEDYTCGYTEEELRNAL